MGSTRSSQAVAAPERPPVYADENLDRLLIVALRARGVDVVTAREAGRLRAPDEQQLAYATSLGRVLLTHDRGDFRRLHRACLEAGRSHAGIAILPQPGPVARRAVRAVLLLAWLAADGGPASRLAVWGNLQVRLHAGLRLKGYTEHDVRLALGLADT